MIIRAGKHVYCQKKFVPGGISYLHYYTYFVAYDFIYKGSNIEAFKILRYQYQL